MTSGEAVGLANLAEHKIYGCQGCLPWLEVCWCPISMKTGTLSSCDCVQAAILAARRNLKEISKEEISDALERIVAGPEKKGAIVTEAKKRLVAYHEVPFLALAVTILSNPFTCVISVVRRYS